MKSYRSLGLTVVASIVGLFVGSTFLKAKPDEKKEILPQRAGYISMTECIPNLKYFKDSNEELQREREFRSGELAALAKVIESKKKDFDAAEGKDKEIAQKELIEIQRKFEDAERRHRTFLETFSQRKLADLYNLCQKEIAALAKELKLDVVYFCPITPNFLPKKGDDAAKVSLYFQPTAMMPVYLNESIDLTKVFTERLNRIEE